jgi:DNA gyrase subunit A
MAKGRAIVNLLPLQPDEKVVKLLCTRDITNKFIVMVTKSGIIKRTNAQDFENIRSTGIRAVTLREDDELVSCALSSGSDAIILATYHGQGIHFKEDEVRAMGRQASGVIGIRLKRDDAVVGMEVVGTTGEVLFATERGYGKKVAVADFRLAHRGGMGVRTIPTDKRNGLVIGLATVTVNSNILLIDQAGKLIRLPASEVRTMGRQAKGVRLIKLEPDQLVSTMVAFEESSEQDQSSDVQGTATTSGKVLAQTPHQEGLLRMEAQTIFFDFGFQAIHTDNSSKPDLESDSDDDMGMLL